MTKDELKELSAQTYYDNNLGEIDPEDIRYFNEELIDSVEVVGDGWRECKFNNANTPGTSVVRAKATSSFLYIVGTYVPVNAALAVTILNSQDIAPRLFDYPDADGVPCLCFIVGPSGTPTPVSALVRKTNSNGLVALYFGTTVPSGSYLRINALIPINPA